MVPLVITPVTDPDDARLDDYRRLQDHTIRRRLEEAGGFFIVEGWEAVRRLLSSNWEVRSLLVTHDKATALMSLAGRRPFPRYVACRDCRTRCWIRPPSGCDRVGGSPRASRLARVATLRLPLGGPRRDQRSREPWGHLPIGCALGVEGLLMAPSVPDPLYRRSVRVSMGAVLMVPFARRSSWPDDLLELKASG